MPQGALAGRLSGRLRHIVWNTSGISARDFPFSPKNTRQLEAEDLVAVPFEPDGWACLQVIELQRQGPGSLTSLIVGPLRWFGTAPPTGKDANGVPVTEQGLTRIELFTEGGLQVVANSPVVPSGLSPTIGTSTSAPSTTFGVEDRTTKSASSCRGCQSGFTRGPDLRKT